MTKVRHYWLKTSRRGPSARTRNSVSKVRAPKTTNYIRSYCILCLNTDFSVYVTSRKRVSSRHAHMRLKNDQHASTISSHSDFHCYSSYLETNRNKLTVQLLTNKNMLFCVYVGNTWNSLLENLCLYQLAAVDNFRRKMNEMPKDSNTNLSIVPTCYKQWLISTVIR